MDPNLTDTAMASGALIPAVVLHVAFFALIIGAMYADVSSLIDKGEGRVPNAITLSGIFGGLVLNCLAAPRWLDGLGHSASGFAVGFCIFLMLYAMGVLSAGDVKLMGAVGAITGRWFVLNSIVLTTIIGGVIGVLQLGWRGLVQMSKDDVPASATAGPGMEARADSIPVHVVVVGPSAPGSTAVAAPPTAATRKEAPLFLPYGLCITLGCFAAYVTLHGNFKIPKV